MPLLTVVGLIGFCAVLSALSNAPTPPKPMYATADMSVLSLPSTEGGSNTETNLSLPVKVFDSENRGIGDANVIAWSPDRKKAYSGVTDLEGNVILKILNPGLPPGKAEGYIKIKVMREGYRDFTSDYLLRCFGAELPWTDLMLEESEARRILDLASALFLRTSCSPYFLFSVFSFYLCLLQQ